MPIRYTSFDAESALSYVKVLANEAGDHKQIQQLAIMESELLMTLDRPVMAKEILLRADTLQKNPDVLLALSNVEAKVNEKLDWVNQVFTDYGWRPFTFIPKKQRACMIDWQQQGRKKRLNMDQKYRYYYPYIMRQMESKQRSIQY